MDTSYYVILVENSRTLYSAEKKKKAGRKVLRINSEVVKMGLHIWNSNTLEK